MIRTPGQVVAALAVAARFAALDRGTCYDALFEAGPDGTDMLSAPHQPDRALLRALAAEYTQLDAHAATLPDRLHVEWLAAILRIPRLPVLPDRVVAHVTVDPKLAPAVLPRGTLLRGGKDAFGKERRYATADPLTAHGASLAGVRSLAPGGSLAGLPGVAASAPPFPLAVPQGPDAPHVLRISSPALAFTDGTLTTRLSFAGATGVSGLTGAVWRYSRTDGTTSPTTGAVVAGATVSVTLTGGCGAPDGGPPWIECVIPPGLAVPEGFGFTAVTVEVTGRSAYVPQAAFYNDGAVDLTKEFQPFGAVAKRGDAFYLRSDEAFGKALAGLTITVTMQAGDGVLASSAGGSGIPASTATYMTTQISSARLKLGGTYSTVRDELERIGALLADPGDPSVRWQRRVDGHWSGFGPGMDRFGSVTATVSGEVGSERFTVGGQPGHFVRAFLHQGDFGWTAYQAGVADFATKAIAGGPTGPVMPTPPVPPIASSITISYTTSPLPATRVESTSGWRHAVQAGSGTFRPFRRAVSDLGAPGMVAIGLDLPGPALGSSVSLYLDVDSAAPCGAIEPVDARWEWWDGTAWSELAVADGSRQLREAGLLRFVAPPGWPAGCTEVNAAAGRWIRLVTSAPERLGDLRGVVVDAVLAEFVSGAADPALDPSSATALPPGTIKGTLTPVRGVKKVTDLASVRGRGPESDRAYRARASARARHRDRSLTPWDYEQLVALTFPEVAAVRCLPHTNQTGDREPGRVGLVVVPDRPDDPAPYPPVSLVERIVDAAGATRPMGARVAVLCPLYAPATVVATVLLRRGVAALAGKEAIAAALEALLHPSGGAAARWGRSLYASTLVAFLERQPDVNVVTSFELRDAGGAPVEVIEVDACRGLYCSSASHHLTCVEQL
ncbi:baseplate J/gp47 family protein [Actinoplanes campanulatus]|uniref:baseplate J/gp47 family protein n=1 Tax=Actinoplanes campanulatus TaxID=113559 RepID=UPI0031E3ECE5